MTYGPDVTTDLVGWVDQQLVESDIEDDIALLVLAALEGDDALDGFLTEGTAVERPEPRPADEGEPGGTFLTSIEVEGFRGIGPAVTLPLAPRPGLTVVAGRNGSGKSSLSEALEFVLTGDTYRWNKSSVAWRQSWRNLHHPTAAITVRLVEEQSGPLRITATWGDAETDVRNAFVTVQRQGGKQEEGLGGLGWSRALEQFRPILSYDELGGLLEGRPSELYDSLAGILGVEQITDALKRIQLRHKEAKAPATAAANRRKQLATQAAQIDDARAETAVALLRKTAPDVATLRALATGSATVDLGPVQGLRSLLSLTLPCDADTAAGAAQRLRTAVAALATAGEGASARTLARLELLERALHVHEQYGEMTCPVCRSAELDDGWRERSATLAADQRKELEELRVARQDLDLALRQARQLVGPRPAVLTHPPVPDVQDALLAAREAWDTWAGAPGGDDPAAAEALAGHLTTHAAPLVAALDRLRTDATTALARLDDAWQPFATRLGAWCDEWTAVAARTSTVAWLAAAEKWLKANDLRLKNERLAPISDGARDAWARLRQESNVELGDLALTGSGTMRKLRIEASVDDTEAQGFTVLSQGELHALALAIFLPRATMAASPFRFLVIDDPVQAMDPAKVDGLVDLLSELAKTRQVVVLSHDDRLPAAVRRAAVGATVLEVTRGQRSQVQVTTATDPAQRYLDDAFGLVLEAEHERLTDTAMRRTVPGLLRFAVEAAAKDRYFTGRLTRGAVLPDVEAAWEQAATTRQKIILAAFGEPRDNQELESWAGTRPYRKSALRSVGAALHSGLRADVAAHGAVQDVEKFVADLRALP